MVDRVQLSDVASGRRLNAGQAPYADPLGYPGQAPPHSGVLLADRFVSAARPAMDEVLVGLRAAPLDCRMPVLAVGSNASVAQLRAKLAQGLFAVPMIQTHAYGITPGVSAHVSRPGYIPATPIPTPGETSTLFVVWLDPDQLARIDATEPSYDRVALGIDVHPVTDATDGTPISTCDVYVSKHGHLVDAEGVARRFVPQRELIGSLLAESATVREVAGENAETWVDRTRSPDVRDRVRRWIQEGRARRVSPWNG